MTRQSRAGFWVWMLAVVIVPLVGLVLLALAPDVAMRLLRSPLP